MTAAAADNYWADLTVIQVTPPGGTATPIAMGQECEFTKKASVSYARGMGSEFIQNRAQYALEVDVAIKFIKFLPAVSSWWPSYILDPTGGTGTMQDTCRMALFTVTGEIYPMTTGNDNLLRTVTAVSFAEFPLKISYNQWVPIDLKGTGQMLVDSNPGT